MCVYVYAHVRGCACVCGVWVSVCVCVCVPLRICKETWCYIENCKWWPSTRTHRRNCQGLLCTVWLGSRYFVDRVVTWGGLWTLGIGVIYSKSSIDTLEGELWVLLENCYTSMEGKSLSWDLNQGHLIPELTLPPWCANKWCSSQFPELYVHRQLIIGLWQCVFLPEFYSKPNHFKVDTMFYREYKPSSLEINLLVPLPLSTSLDMAMKALTDSDSDIV